MKLFILSSAENIHTIRWVNSLAERGNRIFLFSFFNPDNDYKFHENVELYNCKIQKKNTLFHKVSYLSTIDVLKEKIDLFAPDILHAHYASSYGLLGALTDFHPYVISAWGSDVYDFPRKNILTKWVLKYNLHKADYILSTSYVMAKEIEKYTNKQIWITPFGVDINLFKKQKKENLTVPFVIGCVKSLTPKYGIDVLIKTFRVVVDRNPGVPIKLQIIGDGSYRKEYQHLVNELGLGQYVQFMGKIVNDRLPEYYNKFSVSVFTSVLNSESFGVSVVEAMACECPVVASSVEGYLEVIKDGETGIIVPKGNIEITANAIQRFIDNPDLGKVMGEKGRKRVKDLYDWDRNVETMIGIYKTVKYPFKKSE